MASVQELLLANRAERSPLISLLEGAAQGVGTAQSEGVDRMVKLIQIDKMRQEQEQMKRDAIFQEQRRKKFLADQEASTAAIINEASVKPKPSFPQQKLLKTTIDEKGNITDVYGLPEEDSSNKISASLLYQMQKDANEKAQGKQLPSNTVLAANEGKAVALMLPDVEKAIKANMGKFGPVTGVSADLNPYNERAKSFDAEMRSASQSFGRFMEGGVLRKEDEAKYLKMFPQKNDPDKTKIDKLSIVKRKLASKFESDRKALEASGYDVKGLGSLEIPPSIFEDETDANKKSGIVPGTVEDGYRFKGGDPADKNNWEKQ
jgi:hypothetical protein